MEKVDPDSKRSGMTMTVSELIGKLQEYDLNSPIVATWENVFAGIRPELFEVEYSTGVARVVIDVEDYG